MKTKQKFYRYFAFFMALNIIFEVISPTVALALTSGPYQPEYASFEPASSSEMVDLFTGDFKYNIPLLDVDGYPVNLSYHAGATMDEEASWVGLGWNLNAGAMTRQVRGVPDDFKGDLMETVTNLKDHKVWSVGAVKTIVKNGGISNGSYGIGHGTFLERGLALVHNNYKGYGLEFFRDDVHSLTGMLSYGASSINGSVGGGIGMKISSLDGPTLNYSRSYGFGISPGLSIAGINLNYSYTKNVGVGTSTNLRTGEAYKSYNGSTTHGFSASMPISANKNGFNSSVGSASFGGGSPGTTYSSGGGASVNFGKTVSHTIPVSSLAYSMKMLNNFRNKSSTFSLKLGFYLCIGLNIGGLNLSYTTGDYSGLTLMKDETRLMDGSRNREAFGYLNLENANANSILDFNRTNEGPIHRESPNLPLTNHTYDIFSATAQGLYHNFRAHRSDAGIVYDNIGTMTGSGSGTSIEIAAGLFGHFGLAKFNNSVSAYNGLWSGASLNNSQSYYNPDITTSTNKSYEKHYFKSMGELVAVDNSFHGKLGSTAAISPAVGFGGSDLIDATASLGSAPIGGGKSAVFRTKRDIRNTYYGNLNAFEASQYGFEKDIKEYQLNDFDINPINRELQDYTNQPRVFGGNEHHLSEMTVVSSDGSRYIYGVPVYNKLNKKIVFNASDRNITQTSFVSLGFNSDKSLVEYDGQSFATTNTRGLDFLYREETTPQYPQNFLLSCVVSSDYVDITGDGPSYDDLGEYTKFNYTKCNDYKWRTPVKTPITSQGWAVHDVGLIADEFDNKGIVEYGEKELRYLHSIETKNYVAEFHIEPRNDAIGVDDIDGNITASASKMYRLKKIELYSKNEKLRALATNAPPAVPLKTVHFEYDYSLCGGVPNSTAGGKLTLTRIYFTYGKSDKGSLAPYNFYYGDIDHNTSTAPTANPSYDMKATDRWGNFKPDSNTETGNKGTLNNDEFPYAEQSKPLADLFAASWNLTTIETPTGAKINIDYEADDYGYVQNESVGQMLKIADVTYTKNPTINELVNFLTPNAGKLITEKDYLVIDLEGLHEAGVTTTEANNGFLIKNLFNNKDEIYFRTFTRLNTLTGPAITKSYYDWVSGYTKIDFGGSAFLTGSGQPTYSIGSKTFVKFAFIKLVKVGIKDDNTGIKVNPLSKAGWQFMRNYLPRIAYPGSEPATSSTNPLINLLAMLQGLQTTIHELKALKRNSPNLRFLLSLYCSEIDCEKSFIRAYNPHKAKLGGGHRVKQIMMGDSWRAMENTEATSYYGQKYEYTTNENPGKVITSSGVAQYEPMAGGDEISLRKPIHFEIDRSFAPNDNFFQEEPLGEMFYPSPLVGYSKVTITPIANTDNPSANTSICSNGKTEYNFYTAKDFPILTQKTGLSPLALENDPIEDFTVISHLIKIYAAAQGHVLELNDMHGKLKSVKAFPPPTANNPNPAPVSEVSYIYNQSGSKLNNVVSTVDRNNVIQSQTLGQVIDLTTDLRLNNTTNVGTGVYNGVDMSPCSLGFPSYSNNLFGGSQSYGMGTASITKIIQRYGILKEVISFDGKVKSTIKNLLWDGSTGDVVLSSTTNNFDKPVYSFHYPAHWMYNGMSHEYNRHGFTLKIPASTTNLMDLSSGILDNTSIVSGFLNPGDEVVFYNGNNTFFKKAWVFADKINTNDYYLLDVYGAKLNTSNFSSILSSNDHYIKVTRPAEHNLLTFSSGFVNTLNNPIAGNLNLSTKILSSEATEFCEHWNMYDASSFSGTTDADNAGCYNTSTVRNPYTSGYSGNWRIWRSFAYKADRSYAPQQNIGTDGTFASYNPFWIKTGSNPWEPIYASSSNYDRWVKNYENMIYSPHGDLLETKDAIGLYHSRDFTFNHNLVKAEASNSKYHQMGFESFEDFGFVFSYLNKCGVLSNDHLDFANNISTAISTTKPYITNTQSHSGRYSIEITPSKGFILSHLYNSINPNEVTDIPNNFQDRCGGRYDLTAQPSLIGKLNLDPGKYIVSFWIKGPSTFPLHTVPDFSSNFTFDVKRAGNSVVAGGPVKSAVINGWQKFDYTICLDCGLFPAATPPVPLTFHFQNIGSSTIYMDDFRNQPFNSNMVAYVYDPYQMRLMAKLDDRNFATYLEYDNEGVLVRTKKETEKGIYTVTESRQSIIKQ